MDTNPVALGEHTTLKESHVEWVWSGMKVVCNEWLHYTSIHPQEDRVYIHSYQLLNVALSLEQSQQLALSTAHIHYLYNTKWCCSYSTLNETLYLPGLPLSRQVQDCTIPLLIEGRRILDHSLTKTTFIFKHCHWLLVHCACLNTHVRAHTPRAPHYVL